MTTASQAVIRPGWNPLSIALMVIGFIIFWPLGLAMLAYILWGDRMGAWARAMRKECAQGSLRDWKSGCGGVHSTGNAAFDEYRARELARLEKERAQIDAMRSEFDAFLKELRRARDQEEFDRFIAARQARKGSRDTDTTPGQDVGS